MTAKQSKLIIQFLEEGLSIRKTASRLGLSRYAVSKSVQDISKQKTENSCSFSKLEEHREEIQGWLEQQLSVRLIHQRLLGKQVSLSYSSLTRYLKSRKKKEVYVPLIAIPGEEAQVDFGYLGYFENGDSKVKVWVFNMVLSYSRYAFYKIVTDQRIHSFLKCHAEAFEFFQGVPASVKIDNLRAGVLESGFYEPAIQQRYHEFLDHYGTTAVTARVCRGQDKGKVEAGIKYIKNNFLKSLTHRDFGRVQSDLIHWVKTVCNLRVHGTTHKIPSELYFKTEKSALIALPDERFNPVESEERKVNQYGHVYYKKNYYSVPHHYAGHAVLLESNDTTLKLFKDGKLLAMHAINRDSGQFITVEGHKPFYKQIKSEAYYLEQGELIGPNATRLFRLLQAEKPFHWKNIMKGIFSLTKVYSPALIDKACERAILSSCPGYKKVRQFCEKGFQMPAAEINTVKNVNGYFHELSIYDQLVNK